MRRLATILLATGLVLAAAPAQAETARYDDPAGDGSRGDRLDITSFRVAHRAAGVTITYDLVEVTHGNLALQVQAEGHGRPLFVASKHRAGGDRTGLLTEEGLRSCRGLVADWHHVADRIRVRVPGRCFADGDHDAVRVRAISETATGGDIDVAPEGPRGGWAWTPYVGRD